MTIKSYLEGMKVNRISSLLFDSYTQNWNNPSGKCRSYRPHPQFQRLKELVGDDAAVDIWDAATAEGAEGEEFCFLAGLKAGVALMVELFSLSG